MTVRCLPTNDQLLVCHRFQHENADITDLSYEFKVSRRTIIRVLEEAGIDPQIRRRTKKALEPVQSSLDLAPPKQPWYRRLAAWLRSPSALPLYQ